MKKPECQLVGTDGNIFALLGVAARCLRKVKQYDQEKEMKERVFKSGSYDEALTIICEYVDAY